MLQATEDAVCSPSLPVMSVVAEDLRTHDGAVGAGPTAPSRPPPGDGSHPRQVDVAAPRRERSTLTPSMSSSWMPLVSGTFQSTKKNESAAKIAYSMYGMVA